MKFDHTIYNLFLIAFMNDYFNQERTVNSIEDYEFMTGMDTFKMLQDCAPENEVCERLGVWKGSKKEGNLKWVHLKTSNSIEV